MLGIVNFERDLTSKALEYLKQAETLYLEWEDEGSKSIKHFCLTLFYLAQAYSNLGEADQGARYCALTLDMQLKTKTYATQDWTQNAVQLAGFYLDKGLFATSHNLLEAAKAVLREDIGELKDFIPTGADMGDVPANLILGWAKFFLCLVVSSKDWKLSGGSESVRQNFEAIEQEIATELRFGTLHLSPCPFLGKSALFSTFEYARDAFNKSMQFFKKALEHYKLDGWVTEYFQITMDISALYKALAVFESDPHRRCVMHRKRSKRIEGVIEDLNPKYFPGIWKSALLELADIYREIMDIKNSAGRPARKIYKAGVSSVQFYRKFLEAFEETEGGIENLGEDDLLYYIKARFELGRILHKLYSVYPENLGNRNSCMSESLKHLQWIEDFTATHGKLPKQQGGKILFTLFTVSFLKGYAHDLTFSLPFPHLLLSNGDRCRRIRAGETSVHRNEKPVADEVCSLEDIIITLVYLGYLDTYSTWMLLSAGTGCVPNFQNKGARNHHSNLNRPKQRRRMPRIPQTPTHLKHHISQNAP